MVDNFYVLTASQVGDYEANVTQTHARITIIAYHTICVHIIRQAGHNTFYIDFCCAHSNKWHVKSMENKACIDLIVLLQMSEAN